MFWCYFMFLITIEESVIRSNHVINWEKLTTINVILFGFFFFFFLIGDQCNTICYHFVIDTSKYPCCKWQASRLLVLHPKRFAYARKFLIAYNIVECIWFFFFFFIFCWSTISFTYIQGLKSWLRLVWLD